MKANVFRNQVKALPNSIYDEISELLVNHGLNVKVTSIEVMALDDIDNKPDCIAAGGMWACRHYNDPNKPPRCRCKPRPNNG